MFPLNGPTWTLFFEYIGNLLYALLFRRLSFRWLALFSLVCGLVLSWFAIGDPMGYGMLGVGWSLKGLNFYAGLFRMLYPFSLGLLLSRVFVPCKVRGAFWICSLTLVVLFCVPYLGGLWNGLYEMFCITVVFPLLVWLGRQRMRTPCPNCGHRALRQVSEQTLEVTPAYRVEECEYECRHCGHRFRRRFRSYGDDHFGGPGGGVFIGGGLGGFGGGRGSFGGGFGGGSFGGGGAGSSW